MLPRFSTITAIRDAFERRGLTPRHRWGQNFLIDPNLQRFVAEAAELEAGDVVLEVGPGTGALTQLLCKAAGAVVAVEIDPALADMACEACEGAGNVQVICGDALAKGRLAPGVVEALEEAREHLCPYGHTTNGCFKLVANLPYGAATAVLRTLLADGPRPAMVVATVQKEVAERMAASPGSKDYGLLSLLVQSNGTVERLRDLRPEVFWPRPAVTSAVVRMRTWERPLVPAADLAAVAGKLFGHRRKTAASAARQAGLFSSAAEAQERMAKCGVDPRARPEQLSLDDYIRLAQEVLGG